MLRSMTSYGKAELNTDQRRFSVEIKSVNHKYGEFNIKLPRFLNEFDATFRNEISKKVSRGKVEVYMSFNTTKDTDVDVELNKGLCDSYVREYNKMIELYDLDDKITLSLLSSVPDILKVDRNIVNDDEVKEIADAFLATLDEALNKFIAMREKEGLNLKTDLVNKLNVFSTYVSEIEKIYPEVLNNYKQNLEEKAKKILDNTEIDENRILLEVMIFADKSTIDEEITRLYSHIEQFFEIIETKEPVGRKLDFLVQEMNREVNTVASKSCDLEITKIAVELKSILEKIREQVQNIE